MDKRTDVSQIHRGDIYFADFSGSVGSELKGVRPVIIMQNNIGNKYSPTTSVIPLTSRVTKKQLPTHVYLNSDECGIKTDSIALAEQIVTLDKSRLKGFVSSINNSIMDKINNALLIQCGIVDMGVVC